MHYARLSCRLRKPSASTARLLPTGRSSQAEVSLPHSSISHYVWADSGWAQRYIDTLQRHGRPGIPSSPPYKRPLELRTLTPYSHSLPSYEDNFANYKLRYHNKWTHPSLLLKSLGAALRTNGSQKNTGQHDTTNGTSTASFQPLNKQHPESHPYLPKRQKYRCSPATTRQRSLRGRRQVLRSIACQTTNATSPTREPASQHFSHMPQRQCCQTRMRLHHR